MKLRTAAAMLLASVLLASAASAGEARDQHGREHAWKGGVGALTVLDFAASWCAPCRRTLPRLQAFAAERPGLRVLVVSVDDEVEGRDRLVADLDLELPVLWDEGYAISDHYQPEAMPTTVVLDADGKEIYRHGGSSESDWAAFVAFVDARNK